MSSVLADASAATADAGEVSDYSGWWRVGSDPADTSPARAVEVSGTLAERSLTDAVLLAETALAAAYDAGVRGLALVAVRFPGDV